LEPSVSGVWCASLPALTVFSNAEAAVGSILTFIRTCFLLSAAASMRKLTELLLTASRGSGPAVCCFERLQLLLPCCVKGTSDALLLHRAAFVQRSTSMRLR
jgi:hypothetical protein